MTQKFTSHAEEIAHARRINEIEAAGEERAARVADMARDGNIRLHPIPPRVSVLRRLVWPVVVTCGAALLMMGWRG